jgi:site-specific DNA-methyltransferase (adenine-specific)
MKYFFNMLTITNEDNMALMARYPDNYFELAIVDPPYGIEEITGKESSNNRGKINKQRVFGQQSAKFKDWDKVPTNDYFIELMRISKNQIIWGGNYFDLPKYRHPIVWDKCQPWENFSQIELAWTSFNKPASLFKFDNRTGDKIHPTQKPIKLYKWLLDKYAKQGDKILDTHLGSGSIAIACHDYGFDLTACELDKEYFDKAMERIKNHTNQTKLF